MKTGELWTPKQSHYSWFFKREDGIFGPDYYYGVEVIELTKYLGDDVWEFQNRGTVDISGEDSPHSSRPTLSGKYIYAHFLKIGESGNPEIEDRLKREHQELAKKRKLAIKQFQGILKKVRRPKP